MRKLITVTIGFGLLSASCVTSSAVQYVMTVDGSDAIFLAGRTDLTPPPLSNGNPNAFVTVRHDIVPIEATVETLPPFIPVAAGDVIKVSDPASGGINFFNGYGPPFFGPEGNAPSSSITSLGGISGYMGTQGALAGVFLDNSIPDTGPAPLTLDFQSEGARNFTTLNPGLGQVFFIGDGLNSDSVLQSFIAPVGATRLFFGIPDGFAFSGPPGAYDDNDGSYQITIGVNENPPALPDSGQTLLLALLGLGGLAISFRAIKKTA